LTQINYADGTSENWTYNAYGGIATHTDGRGVTITTSVDSGGRATDISYSDGTPNVSFTYDADGFKTSVTGATGTISYTYDTAGRLISRATPQGTVAYAYDAVGRTISQTVGSSTTSYTYDAANRLLSAASPNGTTSYGYDAIGRLSTVTNPNGTTETRSYDAVTSELTQIWHRTAGGATLKQFNYTYDAMGRKTGEWQSDGTLVAYAYDDAGQLTSEIRTGTNLFTASYTYDNAGNRLTKTVNGTMEAYAYDAGNKLLSITGANPRIYGYDNAGNLTSCATPGSTMFLTWDGAGRLVGAGNGTLTNTFSYNGIGQRVGKSDSHGTFAYTLASDAIDSSVLADGQATYQYGMGRVSEVRGGVSSVYHSDSLGTARALSDSTGALTDSLETDAFGNPVAVTGSPLGTRPFGFAAQAGYETDTDTGLMRLGHRYYDASAGRFISRDPLRAGHNWYAYCSNDPVNATDPSGLQIQGVKLVAASTETAVYVSAPPVVVTGEVAAELAGGLGTGLATGGVAGTQAGVATGSLGVGAGVGTGVGAVIGAGVVAVVDLVSEVATGHSVSGVPEMIVNSPVGQVAVDWVAEHIYGAPGNSNCFVAGTIVQMADGSTKPIEDIQVGDLVLSRDQNSTEEEDTVSSRVVLTFRKEKSVTLLLSLSNGEQIETTLEHPFFVRGKGWIAAGHLTSSDKIVTQSKSVVSVEKAERCFTGRTVYNFEVEDTHTYFVGQHSGGIWVHNVCPPHWGNPDTLDDHYDRHGGNFGATDPNDYANKAHDHWNRSGDPGYQVKISPYEGTIKVYEDAKNSFGVYDYDGNTITFYKPRRGYAYWLDEPGWSP
jgi:RHS repeat-associated protein